MDVITALVGGTPPWCRRCLGVLNRLGRFHSPRLGLETKAVTPDVDLLHRASFIFVTGTLSGGVIVFQLTRRGPVIGDHPPLTSAMFIHSLILFSGRPRVYRGFLEEWGHLVGNQNRPIAQPACPSLGSPGGNDRPPGGAGEPQGQRKTEEAFTGILNLEVPSPGPKHVPRNQT